MPKTNAKHERIDSPPLLVLDRDTGDLVEYRAVRRVTPKSAKSAEKALKMASGVRWIVCRMGLKG
jgi:hypothetical protein